MTLYNGSNTAAGVYAGEEDNTYITTTLYSATGAMVGDSNRGPVGVPTLCTSKKQWKQYFGKRDASLTFAHFAAERFLGVAQQLYFVRVDTGALYGSGSFVTQDDLCVPYLARQGFTDPSTEYDFGSSEIILFYAVDPGAWNNNLRVVVYPDTSDVDNEQFVVEVYESSYSSPVESYRATLRDKVNGLGKQLNIVDQLEAASYSRIRAVVNTSHPQYVASSGATRTINAVAYVDFSYGENGSSATVGQIVDAWDLFSNEDEYDIRLLINAGYSDVSVQQQMLALCESRRDCFAILDMPSDLQGSVTEMVTYRRDTLAADTSFGAIYTADILESTDEDPTIYVPPSGAIAAVFANSDAAEQVWFAPAGVIRGVISDITGVRYTYELNERNILDQNQINFIHKFKSYGLCVFAAKTLTATESARTDIPVRRMINLIETEAKYNIMGELFDPNDPYLWTTLKTLVESILAPIKAGRGLYSYSVKCDSDTNPAAQIANGDVAVQYTIEPVRYAKRLLFTTTLSATGDIATAVQYVEDSYA